MKPAWKKSIRDLTSNPPRTLLVLFALTLGLWGVGSGAVSYTILKNDLRENFMRTVPAHAVFTSDEFARLDLKEFRGRPQIESAELRDLSIHRIEVFPDKWIPLWVFGVQDFNNVHLAKIQYQSGRRIPGPGTFLIERDGLNARVSNLKAGAPARVRVGGKIRDVMVSGITFDAAQAPATQDAFIYAYADKRTYSEITGEPADRRLILRFRNVTSRADVERAANVLMEDLHRRGIVVSSSDIPKFDEHPHQFQLNTLLVISTAIGLLSFIMGAVMVSQLITAILASQIRQIGILKAVGATRPQVLGIYLRMVGMLALASTLAAIPLSFFSGYAYARFVAKTLNFDILSLSLPINVYVYIAGAGLLLPVLLSAPLLFGGLRTSVADAIADYGIQPDRKAGTLGFLSRLFLPGIVILAVRNTLRRRARFAVTIGTMGLGVAIFSTGFNVREALVRFLADAKNSMRHDVQIVLSKSMGRDEAVSRFQKLANVKRIETWNGGKGRLQTGRVSTAGGIGIVALPYDTDLLRSEILSGRWIAESDEFEIVMNQGAWDRTGKPVVGETFLLDLPKGGVRTRLVGVVKEFDVGKIYIDQKKYDFAAGAGGRINSLMVVARDRDYAHVIALKKEIERTIAGSDLDILYVVSQAERSQIIYDHLDIILTVLSLLAFLVLSVSALGMAAAMGITIMERTREIGVMRAIGAAPGTIFRLFVAEGMVVSAVSVLVGSLFAWPLSTAASVFFGNLILGSDVPLAFAFSLRGFFITVVLTLGFGILASRIPAGRAVRVSTREAIAYE